MAVLPVAREGVFLIVVPAAASVAVFAAGSPWGGAGLGLAALALALFFRDPRRQVLASPGQVLSPADGRVVAVDKRTPQPLGTEALRISVFMSVFNVHINRIPFGGRVLDVRHIPGGFAMAHLDEASVANERAEVLIEDEDGRRYLMVQVAGLVARRIVCRLVEGDAVTAGSRFGLICLGSRVDLYLPAEARPTVKVGDKVRAGLAVIAEMG
ncbi:MAG: phosphatidylserine decarboxylase family protein [bacterium]|nr:MAG: phosphatidylserine decarboxylase family protein [bacterium]